MNLLLLDPEEIRAGDRVVLDDGRAEHLLRVLRVEPGRELRAGIVGDRRVTATVLAVGAGRVELEIERGAAPEPRAWTVDLVVGLPRPQALHRLLQTAAGMEVRTLHLTRSWRVEKSFFHSPSLEPGRIRRQLLLGAEQGASVHLPEVRLHRRFRDCLEELGEPGEGSRLVADPDAGRPLPAELPAGAVTIALGPEGGWIDRELGSLREAGFAPFRLGPWILKVEMAATAALAQLHRLGGGRGEENAAPAGPSATRGADPARAPATSTGESP